MSPHGFFRSLKLLFALGLFVGVGLAGTVAITYSELSKEARFRSLYGASWRAEYEQVCGSLATAHARIALAVVGFVAICVVIVWLSRLLRSDASSRHSSGRKHRGHRHRHGSELERAAVCRRRAIVGIYFGLVGIALGIFLVIFRTRIFQDHANEIVLGMFVFLAGYSGIIAGCSYWLKAKQCNDAIVFIGLSPLAIPLIPFVRLILLATPAILVVGMIMMPLILIVVVAVLPDKSGARRQKALWGRDQAVSSRFTDSSIKMDASGPNPALDPTIAAGGSRDESKLPEGS